MAHVDNLAPGRAVKNHFREYKKILIDLVGNGPMDEDTIDTIGKASVGRR